MADDRKRNAKSESLTIRLNPRTRFVLEFVARMRGQTITTVVERALEAAGDQAKIVQDFGEDKSWKDYWDVSEGVRSLKIAAEPELFPTFEEEKRLHFAKKFWEYFFKNPDCNVYSRVYIDILWPRIDEFLEIHEQTKMTEYYRVERDMRKALSDAQVKAPISKAGVKDPVPPKTYDLDDDIPF